MTFPTDTFSEHCALAALQGLLASYEQGERRNIREDVRLCWMYAAEMTRQREEIMLKALDEQVEND